MNKDIMAREIINEVDSEIFIKVKNALGDVEALESSFKAIAESLIYKGFDLEALVSKILLTAPVDNKLSDISMMVAIGIEKGNNYQKFKKFMGEDIARTTEKLITNYKIELRIKNGTTATFSRIVQCFPVHAVYYTHYHATNLTVTPLDFTLRYGYDLPKGMFCSAFPALIPKGLEQLMALMVAIQMMISEKIGTSGRPALGVSRNKIYVDATFKGSYVPQHLRIKMCQRLGICTDTGNLTDSITRAVQHISTRLGLVPSSLEF